MECSSHAFVRPAGDVQFDVCHLFVVICVCRVNKVGSLARNMLQEFQDLTLALEVTEGDDDSH